MNRLVIAAFAAVLLLAGCAPGPTPDPGQTDGPTPTTTAQPAGLPVPSVRFDATCDEVGSKPAFDDYLDGEIDGIIDETTPITTLASAAMLTAGTLRCRWSSGPTEYYYPDEYISIVARPDANDGYRDTASMYIEDGYTVFDGVGDSSIRFCYTDEDYWSCRGEVLTGTTWITVEMNAKAPDGHPVPDSVAEQRVDNTMKRAVDHIGEGAVASWTVPEGAFGGKALCRNDSPKLKALLKEKLGYTKPYRFGYDAFFTDYWTYAETGAKECGWADETGKAHSSVIFSTLPGSEWWAQSWNTDPPSGFADETQQVPVDGLGDVYIGCKNGECTSTFLWGGSVIEIYSSQLKKARLMSLLTALPARLEAG